MTSQGLLFQIQNLRIPKFALINLLRKFDEQLNLYYALHCFHLEYIGTVPIDNRIDIIS
jgi:hypothetical protein